LINIPSTLAPSSARETVRRPFALFYANIVNRNQLPQLFSLSDALCDHIIAVHPARPGILAQPISRIGFFALRQARKILISKFTSSSKNVAKRFCLLPIILRSAISKKHYQNTSNHKPKNQIAILSHSLFKIKDKIKFSQQLRSSDYYGRTSS